jgi:hypothetical protein
VNGCHHLPSVSRDRKQSLVRGLQAKVEVHPLPGAAFKPPARHYCYPTWANLVRKSGLPALKLRVVTRWRAGH